MKNYVEDSDAQFRFGYPVDFLKWALLVPDYKQSWHVGVRATSNKKLLGFISGTPTTMEVDGEEIKMAEINFLCVHKKLRTKKLTPLLIKEITRRVNLKNIWKAVYTAGVVFPTPFTTTTYYHRNLNAKKLVEVGFTTLPQNYTMARFQKKFALDDDIELEL
jgi:glycylpeptide N-tetradecanoyltransferase